MQKPMQLQIQHYSAPTLPLHCFFSTHNAPTHQFPPYLVVRLYIVSHPRKLTMPFCIEEQQHGMSSGQQLYSDCISSSIRFSLRVCRHSAPCQTWPPCGLSATTSKGLPGVFRPGPKRGPLRAPMMSASPQGQSQGDPLVDAYLMGARKHPLIGPGLNPPGSPLHVSSTTATG